MKLLLAVAALLLATAAQETFHGHQVLRITAKDEVQLALIKDLESLVQFELDFWRGVTDVETPVDVRVPFHSLQSFKIHLESLDMDYQIMIHDLQVPRDAGDPGDPGTRPRGLRVPPDARRVPSSQVMLDEERQEMTATGGTGRPAVWIDTGIHSREWVTQASGTWFAKKVILLFLLFLFFLIFLFFFSSCSSSSCSCSDTSLGF
ncbi:Carboxypeptidase A1 [Liparis tanakae]|uniref:Carboxypeptidase A1 n=1 Tax=Liparis tanakae TaxID=230148 RepID=A0A4Z2ERZ3_9TELE|nr:Carboxypeptidase A1 [Liparis tanakae]